MDLSRPANSMEANIRIGSFYGAVACRAHHISWAAKKQTTVDPFGWAAAAAALVVGSREIGLYDRPGGVVVASTNTAYYTIRYTSIL